MKKLLFFLFIAILFLSNVVLSQTFEEEFEEAKKNPNTFKEWLMKNGIWDPIVNALNTQLGDIAAYKVCQQWAPRNICTEIIKFIIFHR